MSILAERTGPDGGTCLAGGARPGNILRPGHLQPVDFRRISSTAINTACHFFTGEGGILQASSHWPDLIFFELNKFSSIVGVTDCCISPEQVDAMFSGPGSLNLSEVGRRREREKCAGAQSGGGCYHPLPAPNQPQTTKQRTSPFCLLQPLREIDIAGKCVRRQ